MKYRDIIGYSDKQPKKKVVKKQPKPSVTEGLKKQFGDTMNEGPAYEYAKHTKNIEKSWDVVEKRVMKLAKEITKKGHKDVAFKIEKRFEAVLSEFNYYFEKEMEKLQ